MTETPDDGLTVKATKTGKQRFVPLDDLTVAELRTVQRKQRARHLEFGVGWQRATKPAEDWIASTQTGSVIAPDDYTNAFLVLTKRRNVAETPAASATLGARR